MGSWKTFERTLDGPLQAGRQVSAIALFPCSSCSSESANCPGGDHLLGSVWPILPTPPSE